MKMWLLVVLMFGILWSRECYKLYPCAKFVRNLFLNRVKLT